MRMGTELNIPEAIIREELAQLLKSRMFQQSDRLGRFLRYTIDRVLEGRQSELKEYVIGVEVYDRRPPYDPNQDSIVRTEARRLRAKLKGYYEGEGRDREIYIYYRLGSYAPVFRRRDTLNDPQQRCQAENEFVLHRGPAPVLAIMPFHDLGGGPHSHAFSGHRCFP